MNEIKLRPAINSGQEYTKSGAFIDMAQWRAEGYCILQVNFFNQGTNSTATINIGGVDILLPPGSLKQGSNLVLNQPSGFHDTTKYRVTFASAGIGGTQVNNLKVIFTMTKILPGEK